MILKSNMTLEETINYFDSRVPVLRQVAEDYAMPEAAQAADRLQCVVDQARDMMRLVQAAHERIDREARSAYLRQVKASVLS